MIHSIKIKISDNIDKEGLYDSIESVFNKNHFKVERKDSQLTFERVTPQTTNKFQLIAELYEGFTQGRIYIDNQVPVTLICKIVYSKQLIVSLIVGLMVTIIFSMYTGSFWKLFFQLGLPVTLLFLVMGILSGNSRINDLLRKVVGEGCS